MYKTDMPNKRTLQSIIGPKKKVLGGFSYTEEGLEDTPRWFRVRWVVTVINSKEEYETLIINPLDIIGSLGFHEELEWV